MKKLRKLVALVLLIIFPLLSSSCLFIPYGVMAGVAYLGVGALGTYIIMDKVREEKEPDVTSEDEVDKNPMEWERVELKMEKNIAQFWDVAVTAIRSRGTKIVEKSSITIELFKRDGYVVGAVRKNGETLSSVKVKFRKDNEWRAIEGVIRAL